MIGPQAGEVWEHVVTGRRYLVHSITYDAVGDCEAVLYVPLYPCGKPSFVRRLHGPKGWCTPNSDGTPRFRRADREMVTI